MYNINNNNIEIGMIYVLCITSMMIRTSHVNAAVQMRGEFYVCIVHKYEFTTFAEMVIAVRRKRKIVMLQYDGECMRCG